VSRPALGILCIGTGVLWLVATSAERPAVVLGLVAGFMLIWAFRRDTK
jgi:hypothetical protein